MGGGGELFFGQIPLEFVRKSSIRWLNVNDTYLSAR